MRQKFIYDNNINSTFTLFSKKKKINKKNLAVQVVLAKYEVSNEVI